MFNVATIGHADGCEGLDYARDSFQEVKHHGKHAGDVCQFTRLEVQFIIIQEVTAALGTDCSLYLALDGSQSPVLVASLERGRKPTTKVH